MDTPQELTVVTNRDGRVATVTLNRPHTLNAITPPMRTLLMETLARLDEDPAVGCVVLTGRGRGFCSGADTSGLQRLTGARMQADINRQVIAADYPFRMAKPLIAAVNGPVAGIGLCYALMADVRFAAVGAKWVASFAALGLPAEDGISWLLPRLVGPGAALEIMLSAEPITSETAHRIGLVQRVLPTAEVLPAALRLAAVIASRSPHSLRAIKEQVRLDATRPWHESVSDARQRLLACLDGPDFAEAMAARRAGRDPDFHSRTPPDAGVDLTQAWNTPRTPGHPQAPGHPQPQEQPQARGHWQGPGRRRDPDRPEGAGGRP